MAAEYREYTKISIHNHFGGPDADCKLDREVSFKPSFDLTRGYAELLKAHECGYRLLAQTNANSLDASAYLLMRARARLLGIELLPGAELNLINWDDVNQVLHTVVVFSPSSNVFEIQEAMREHFCTNGRYAITIEQLCELLLGKRAILCFHGVKQKRDKRSMSENANMAEELLSLIRFFPVAIEDNQSYQKYSLMAKLQAFVTDEQYEWIDTQAAILSSVDRTALPDVKSPTHIWAGNSFDDLYYCVLTGSGRITREEHIVERVSYISEIVVDAGAGMLASRVDCSQGLNCIVGASGSGKTLLLDMIRNGLTSRHLERSSSSTGTYDQLYDLKQVHLLGPHGEEIGPSDEFEVLEGTNLYDRVIKAYSSDKADLVKEFGIDVNPRAYGDLIRDFSQKASDYLECMAEAKRYGSQAAAHLAQAKSALKFIAANASGRSDTIAYTRDSSIQADTALLRSKAVQLNQDMTSATKHFAALLEIAKKNDLPTELIQSTQKLRDQFATELLAKKKAIALKLNSMRVTQKRQLLIYQACQDYNDQISHRFQQVNEKEQVVRDELRGLATALLSQRRSGIEARVPAISEEEVKASIDSSNSNNAARLVVSHVSLIVERESLHERFPGIVSPRRVKGRIPKVMFDSCYDLADPASVKALLDVFADNGSITDLVLDLPLDVSVTYSIELQAENGQYRSIDTFSAGELSKVYVMHFLDQAIKRVGSNAIVLYDQPESNMEKEFLLETLADKLGKLRKEHQIFVATHEPLLVVNADANELILATNDKKVGQGNQVGYVNRSFVGAHGKSEAIEEVAKLIDGGSKAVRHRSDVYEGMVG